MLFLKDQYKAKDEIAEQKLKEAFEFKNKTAPVVINDVNYWLFGDIPNDIPDDYCGENPQVMFDFQINKIKRHYDQFTDDCYMGFLMPWFGTGVLASGFGTKIGFNPKMDPAADMSEITHPEQIAELKMPDPYKDGLMPRVLRAIDYFKSNCDLPIGVTDCQGPLTTALSIVGYDKFVYWMYDYPELIHKLMDMVADALIEWVKVQKKHAGEVIEKAGFIIGVKMPEGSGGVWMADDDCVIFSEDLYREFVVPYNSKVLKAFGGGGIHYCGNGIQHRKNYVNTKGLTCLHNFHLDSFDNAALTKQAMENAGIPYIICDFAPENSRLDTYFEEMFGRLDQKGLIVTSYIAPAIGLYKGKYEAIQRDQLDLGMRIKQIIDEKQRRFF